MEAFSLGQAEPSLDRSDAVIDLRDLIDHDGQTDSGRFSMPTISVVIPTLNEAENLPHVLPRIPDWVTEVLIVDGGSVDDTVAVSMALCPDAKVIVERRKGKGVALRAGFELASGEIIVALDADGSTDPAEIPAFVGALVAGHDLVKGSRFVQGGGTDDMELHRRVGNKALTLLVRACFGGRYTDLCYGYFAFWRRVLPELLGHEEEATGFEIETFINVRALQHGLRVTEIASFESARIHGQSNLRTVQDGFRVVNTIARERLPSR